MNNTPLEEGPKGPIRKELDLATETSIKTVDDFINKNYLPVQRNVDEYFKIYKKAPENYLAHDKFIIDDNLAIKISASESSYGINWKIKVKRIENLVEFYSLYCVEDTYTKGFHNGKGWLIAETNTHVKEDYENNPDAGFTGKHDDLPPRTLIEMLKFGAMGGSTVRHQATEHEIKGLIKLLQNSRPMTEEDMKRLETGSFKGFSLY